MSRLALTKNRVENQQTTFEELKSRNEDREISDIIIDYTASYNAYQASLTAASKINQQTLLNYIQEITEVGDHEGKYKSFWGN